MSLTAADIEKIAAWFAEAGLESLDLTGPGMSLRLERGEDGAVVAATATGPGDLPEPAVPAAIGATPVAAPIAGTMRATHPLHGIPLITPGQAVVPGQAMGLIEVGPLLVPVTAPAAGRAAACRAEDGSLVGYGDILFDIHRD